MTMKRLIYLLLLALLLPVAANAHDFEVNGIYYNINGTEATVTYRGTSFSQNSDEYSGSVTIPSSVYYGGTTYSVTSIGEDAFRKCTTLTSVTMPNSVTSLGNYAFYGCSGLTNVTLGNSVTSIGNEAFYNCSSLRSVTIPNSVISIGQYAFYNCSGLTSVTIGNSVSNIGNYVFQNCSALTSIVVESGNTVYDSRDNCNAIIKTSSNTLIAGCKNTNIPNSVTSIGQYAFSGCTGLTSLTIPNSVTSIGQHAFEDCSGLTSLNIGSFVSSIGDLAFAKCSSLSSIKVGSGNTVYDSRDNCNAIIKTSSNTLILGCKNTVIPTTVNSIGNNAFNNCIGLTNFTIII